MKPARFACPVCSEVMETRAVDRVCCGRCSTSYHRKLVDPLTVAVGRLNVKPGEKPDPLLTRGLEHLAQAMMLYSRGSAEPLTSYIDRALSDLVLVR